MLYDVRQGRLRIESSTCTFVPTMYRPSELAANLNRESSQAAEMQHTFYEFFAGGGMARAGLGPNWRCTFANDFDEMKASTYIANWGDEHFVLEDIAKLTPADLPDTAKLAWASFPCQDLSLAGSYRGLGNSEDIVLTRSGTFWHFWRLMTELKAQSRNPPVIVLENVVGTITSRRGRDFAAICKSLADGGYRIGAVVVDAKHFVPQSRPRLFFVAIDGKIAVRTDIISSTPSEVWHPRSLLLAQESLPDDVRSKWIWWAMPSPESGRSRFRDLIEEKPTLCSWHTPSETRKLIAMMTDRNLAKVAEARSSKEMRVGGVYKRTRPDKDGIKYQRAEVRFDDTAGCLRTPSGGSSRQTILVVHGDTIRSRLLSPREAARLMGLPDSYKLPSTYNDAYHVAGDGVCVPAVRHIAEHLLERILGDDLGAERSSYGNRSGVSQAASSDVNR